VDSQFYKEFFAFLQSFGLLLGGESPIRKVSTYLLAGESPFYKLEAVFLTGGMVSTKILPLL